MGLVSECPGNKMEVYAASKRLNCGNDSYGNNLYICLPNAEKTSLVELCYNGIIGLNEKGYCLEASVGKVIQHNCSRFLAGCPDAAFDTNEVYKYPACVRIDTKNRCYTLDPNCQPIKSDDETIINYEAIIYLCIGVLVVACIIAAIFLIHYKKCQWSRRTPTNRIDNGERARSVKMQPNEAPSYQPSSIVLEVGPTLQLKPDEDEYIKDEELGDGATLQLKPENSSNFIDRLDLSNATN